MSTQIDDGNPKGFNDRMEEVLPRRAVLGSALAAGCGLLLPAILIGCDSKKGESPSSSAPADSPKPAADSAARAVAPNTSSNSPAPVAPQKLAQEAVQYQTHPKGVQQCSNCAYFIAESNTCTLVEGQLSPEAWCILWVEIA